MSSILSSLETFLASDTTTALVEVVEAKGSTPREQGAWMLVSADAIFGTIGGGQLEFLAIDKARERLAKNQATGALDIPLGPEIGQCCGGRVALSIDLVDEGKAAALRKRAVEQDAARPHVYLFGGGHVGHALAETLDLLPLNISVVETRAEALAGLPEAVNARLVAVPEEVVRDAPARSAFVVLTHDHALDFLIVAEALKRSDGAYIGMIGSKTKRETFRRWYLKEAGGTQADAARLVCPIGGSAVADKRPAVIAALTSAELVGALARR
jgi:xanthine dehydrogenase accessory factor